MLDTTFPLAYECSILNELPNVGIAHYYYPGATSEGGKDGLLVKIMPDTGDDWIGTFAFGDIAPKGVTGVFSTPARNKLCAVARGQGYFVQADAPAAWEFVGAVPVIDVRPVASKGLLVLATYTELVAYGDSGLQWATERLSWDGLEITDITDDTIYGKFWDVVAGRLKGFSVDLSTGEHRGGAELPT